MIVENDPRRQAPHGERSYGGPLSFDVRSRGGALRRFLGGSPAAVFMRLLFLSVLVGATMAMFGLTPERLFWHAYDTVRALIDLGFSTFHDFGRWIIAGALVVVPLWLISRLFAVSR
ncbi:DUF6460 domain-containing protein [Methylobacterium sp. sgz302541]|uniref:DUF6460 domain-containing protein n=1 Tax=unclassified Methylobacterium TaxID=2615210 RepID=UPI003D358786